MIYDQKQLGGCWNRSNEIPLMDTEIKQENMVLSLVYLRGTQNA